MQVVVAETVAVRRRRRESNSGSKDGNTSLTTSSNACMYVAVLSGIIYRPHMKANSGIERTLGNSFLGSVSQRASCSVT